MSPEEIKKLVDSVPAKWGSYSWWHTILLPYDIKTPGFTSIGFQERIMKHIPEDLRDWKILDIGANDGYYSIECEKRGAKVVAIESNINNSKGFKVINEILNTSIDYKIIDLFDFSPLETFDLILCLGVYYHLKNPLLAFERMCSWTNKTMLLEGHYILGEEKIMKFYPKDELRGDFSNWWGATEACLVSMLEVAGFNRIVTLTKASDRIIMRADK